VTARAARLGLIVLLVAGCRAVETGVHWDLERMLVQPRFRAYGETPLFVDGRMMRPPPEGTVPAGDEEPTALGWLVDGQYRDRFPLPLTMELLRLGQRRFDTTCAACHGVLGDGASPVAMHMQLRPPPPLTSPKVREMPVGRLVRIVEEGYGLMPSYAGLLSPEERWAVVAYVRALQLSQSVELEALPPTIHAEAVQNLASTSVVR
jgi:mono/diheme cytochrome c family protein